MQNVKILQKKIDETAIKMDICGEMAIKRSNEGVFRPTHARHAIQKINFAWPNKRQRKFPTKNSVVL